MNGHRPCNELFHCLLKTRKMATVAIGVYILESQNSKLSRWDFQNNVLEPVVCALVNTSKKNKQTVETL